MKGNKTHMEKEHSELMIESFYFIIHVCVLENKGESGRHDSV